jgi:hypothetical protein
VGRPSARLLAAGMAVVALLALAGTALARDGVDWRGLPPEAFCDEFLKPCGEPVTIAAGEQLGKPLEVVAYSSRIGLCLDVIRGNSGIGTCGGEGAPPNGRRFAPAVVGQQGGRRPFTEIVGTVSSNVADVRLRFKRRGGWRSAELLLAQVQGETLEQLAVEQPFGVLVAAIRGCARRERYRFRGFDSAGMALGKSRVRRIPLGCPGTGGSVVGIPARSGPQLDAASRLVFPTQNRDGAH